MERELKGLTVLPDAQALAEAAARRIIRVLNLGSERLSVCLSGGSTPSRLYQLLTTEPFRSAVPWDRIHWFWGDERFVPHDDPRSNSGAACRLFLNRVAAPTNVHPVSTSAPDADQAALQYEAELRRFYGFEALVPGRPLFDVVLLGAGRDGHTASLFPGRPEVEEAGRWAVSVPKPGLEPFVPRVTLTLPALASTRDMLFLVSGCEKRQVLARIAAGADVPSARAYSHGDLAWLIDRDAAPEGGMPPDLQPLALSAIIVMGVSGSGKSTIASLLANRLGWTYEDADWFHPPANVEKMHSGQPLTDEDRWPWLRAIAAHIEQTRGSGGHSVIACSALKRAYRDILVGSRDNVRIVYLKGERELISRRMALRHGHFMPASLLDSQFATLEEPGDEESPIIVSIESRPAEIVDAIVAKLGFSPRGDGAANRGPSQTGAALS